MNPFAQYIKVPEFSFCSASSGSPVVAHSSGGRPPPTPSAAAPAAAVARSKGKPKRPNAVTPSGASDDCSGGAAASAASVSDVQHGGVAMAAPAAAVARSKGKQIPLKYPLPGASSGFEGLHDNCQDAAMGMSCIIFCAFHVLIFFSPSVGKWCL